MGSFKQNYRRYYIWVILVVAGIMLAYSGYEKKHTEQWLATQGTILQVRMQDLSQGNDDKTASNQMSKISYSYKIGQHEYIGNIIRIARNKQQLEKMKKDPAKYQQGKKVTVYYSNKNASRSSLSPNYFSKANDFFFSAYLLIVVFCIVVILKRAFRK